MSLEDFLNAAKRGDIGKLSEELSADSTIVNATLDDEGLLSGHTAIEFAASELRVDTVNYLLNNGAIFSEDVSWIIMNLLPRGTSYNREIARIQIFSLMLNNNVDITNFNSYFPGVSNFIELVHELRQNSRNLNHLEYLNDFQFIRMILEEEEANTDSANLSTQSTNNETNSTDSQNSGDDYFPNDTITMGASHSVDGDYL